MLIESLKNGDLVITNNSIKMSILEELTKSKKLLNIKFMTIEEFIKNYFGTYDERALYYLIKKYNMKYDVAKEYLDNIYFKTDIVLSYYNELKANDLLIQNDMFKNSLKNIVVIGYENIDLYVKKELSKYNVRYISITQNNFTPRVYGFDKQEDEIAFIAGDIIKKLETVNINDICLVNVGAEYKEEIKRIFDFYNIPINIEKSMKIYSSKTAVDFYDNLLKTKDINKALEGLEINDVYNKIIDILNKYTFITSVDNAFLEIIKNELKHAGIVKNTLKNAVNIESINPLNLNKHYYILGFNQGVYPKIYHDDELIKDSEKEKLGINTSFEKLKNEKDYLKSIIHNASNLTITYKLKDNYSTYYPSPLINELNLSVKENPSISFNYSNAYNKIKLSEALDNYINYGEKSENIEDLYQTYKNIPYKSYDNSFTKLSFEELNKHLKGKTNLSYSSMNNYFLCAFRFYIANILKLNPFESNFAAKLGSLFHNCLAHMYNDGFDLKKEYEKYQQEEKFTISEQFFVDNLYKNLEFIIKTIRKQESYSTFDKVLTEQEVSLDFSSKLTINFLGFIDKLEYKEENGKILSAIIDYKTGYVPTTLNNINYGLHLQLPVYIYLTKKGLHKDVKVVGFYLQKILNKPDIDTNEEDNVYNKLKLDGYTINEEDLIEKFDSTYTSSEVIKGMKTSKNGFYAYTKLVSEEDIEKIEDITEEKIKEVVSALDNGYFPINPKEIDNKLIGCEFCKFKDICFKKEEDVVVLKNTKFEDIRKDDSDA